jgi:hypothetical protein
VANNGKKKPLKVVVVTKPSVATSQLETAIKLWFEEGDPVSIHTLAVAAHDCFDALTTFAGKMSLHREWIKTQSEKNQQWAREPQNFFKHGHRYPKARLHYVPYYAELLIYDGCLCFEHLAKKMRPLMEAFMTRFVMERPEHLSPGLTIDGILEVRCGLKISEVQPLSRQEFLKRAMPGILRFLNRAA